MHNLSKSQLLGIVMLCFMIATKAMSFLVQSANHYPSSKMILSKVEDFSALRHELVGLDSSQFGLCDTCVASYRSAIAENRLVAQELSRQNLLLQTKVLAIKKLNLRVDSLLRVYGGINYQ